MGYRIEYPGLPVKWEDKKLRWNRVLLYGGVCFGLFVLLISAFWVDGREVLIDWFYPGDAVLTRQALIHMAGRLKAGEAFGEALTVFCREILVGG